MARIIPFLAMLLLAEPAWAAGIVIPEPTAMTLVGIGVLGVIVGRHGSRRRRD